MCSWNELTENIFVVMRSGDLTINSLLLLLQRIITSYNEHRCSFSLKDAAYRGTVITAKENTFDTNFRLCNIIHDWAHLT